MINSLQCYTYLTLHFSPFQSAEVKAGLPEVVPGVEVHVGQNGELPAGFDKAGARGQHEGRSIVPVLI